MTETETEKETKNQTVTEEVIPNKRIDYACKKFKKVRNSGDEKFNQLDIWLKKESNIFTKELNYTPTRFMKYKKGTIVKVDFGINIGCELSKTHFAIVMDNNDNIHKETITVIPLTSKGGNNKIDLGSLIFDEFINKMKKEIDSVNSEDDIKELKELIIEYSKYKKLTYANLSQFRCISKNRILYPINKHDLVGKSRVSKSVIEKLTQELFSMYM